MEEMLILSIHVGIPKYFHIVDWKWLYLMLIDLFKGDGEDPM